MSLSSYLYDKAPSLYGGKQDEYLQFSEDAINQGVQKIQSAVGSKKDLTVLFHEVLKLFQTKRAEIAKKHTPDEASHFGTSRTDNTLGGYFAATPLAFPYEKYNRIYLKQLGQILPGIKDKKASSEETALGRRLKFEVEVLDIAELAKRTKPASFNTSENVANNLPLLQQLKKAAPATYQALSLSTFIGDFLHRFGDLGEHLVLGTLRIEINQKLYAASRYLTFFNTDPVQKTAKASESLIGHQDTFLIDETLKDISKIFAEAINHDSEKDLQGLKDRVALLRFIYSHCTPCVRGDGAIGDWLELAIYRYHGFAKSRFNQERLACFETLASISLSRYLKEYDSIITVSKDGNALYDSPFILTN